MTRLTAIVAGSFVALGSAAFADPVGGVNDDPSVPPAKPGPTPTDQPAPIVDQTTPQEQSSLGTIDEYPPHAPSVSTYAWREPGMKSAIGVGFAVGGGVSQFTDGQMRDAVKDTVGGLWNARLSLGTHIPIGLDLSYVGMTATMKNLGGFDNGTLLASTLEGAVRYNVLPHRAFTPYGFVGLGWTRFDVRDTRFATSDTGLAGRDDVLEVPLGAGMSYRGKDGFVADFRGTFHVARNPDLLVAPDGTEADLHSWEASASVGYEL